MRKTTVVVIILVGLLVSFQTFASTTQAQEKAGQSSDAAIAGRYEGVIKTSLLGNVPVQLDLRYDNQKLTGVMHTPLGQINITGGHYDGNRLIIRMEANGDEAIFEGQLAEGKITGNFSGFGQTGTVELKRTGDAPSPVDTRVRLTLSKAQWREDLQFLAKEIPRRHKKAFHTVTREKFERAVAELDAQIPNLNDTQIALNLARIAAMIGDGHTLVTWHWSYRTVPLRLFWFGNELRVTGTTAPYIRALGARIVRIGKSSLAEAFARAQPFIPQGENEWHVKSLSAGFLTYPAFLHAIGLAPDAEHASYTFEDAKGRRFTLDLTALAEDANVTWNEAGGQPLYRLQRNLPLWHTYLPESQTVYFNFKGYPSRKDFQRFSQDLLTFIDNNPIKRLVVDMRQNGGGDFTRGREYIISEIKKRPSINRRGHLFVITGRRTFSAGMANAADFRNETNAILVGEPTGARPNGYQENREFMLPNSHLKVWVSTEFYKFSEQDTPGLMPDHRIDPDWPSYRSGRDLVMEWILKQ
ncbi:MAG: hypothetical protein ICV68_09590 [Pyrinomonadaceae bacterium]|nr:hypothetical protein [Pyrinomonadaceae bacterium]